MAEEETPEVADIPGQRPNWISEHIPEDVAAQLFKFKVKLPNGNEIPVDIESTINVDYENIEDELMSAPQQYVFWATAYSESKHYAAIVERAVKVRRGQIADAVLEEARRLGTKMTDKSLKEVIEKDQNLTKLEVALAKAQKTTGKLWHMVDAMKMKNENLRSLAGFKRQEYASQQ